MTNLAYQHCYRKPALKTLKNNEFSWKREPDDESRTWLHHSRKKVNCSHYRESGTGKEKMHFHSYQSKRAMAFGQNKLCPLPVGLKNLNCLVMKRSIHRAISRNMEN
jgi:hypothetical protein